MKNRGWLKRILLAGIGILASLIVILVALIFWLIADLDTEAGRQRVADIVSRSLNRTVHIGGAISVDLSLHPTIAINDLRIGNPTWAGSSDFLSVERAEAQLALLPFFVRTLEIDWLRATGINLWLERRADGTTNWEFGEWLTRKSVDGVDIERTRVTYRTVAGEEFHTEFSAIEASLSYDAPVEVRTQGRFRGLAATATLHGGKLMDLYSPQTRWAIDGQIRLGESDFGLRGALTDPTDLRDAELELTAQGSGSGTFEALLQQELPNVGRYESRARLRLQSGRYSVAVTARAENLAIPLSAKNADAASWMRVQRIDAELDAEGDNIAELIERANWRIRLKEGTTRTQAQAGRTPVELGIKDASVISERGGGIRLSGDAVINTHPLTVSGELGVLADLIRGEDPVPLSVSVVADGVEANFRGALRPPAADAAFEGELTLHADNLKRLGMLLTSDDLPAVGPIRLSTRVVKPGRSLHVTDLTVEVADSWLRGQVDLIPGAMPGVRILVTRGQIDLGDFEQARTSGAEPGAPSSRVTPQGQRLIPLGDLHTEQVHRLTFELILKRLQFVHNGEPINTLEGLVEASEGRITLALSGTGEISHGIDMRVVLDTVSVPPRLELHAFVRELDYGKALRRVGFSDKVEGTLEFEADLTGRGETLRGALASAQGSVTFTGGEGLVPRRLLELWGGALFRALLGEFAREDETRLNCTAGRFSIDKGVLKSDLVLADTANVTVVGDVAINLKTEELKGVFRSRTKQAALVKIGRPIELSGTLAAPDTRLGGSSIVELGKLIIGLADARALILLFGELGAQEKNPCAALLERGAIPEQ